MPKVYETDTTAAPPARASRELSGLESRGALLARQGRLVEAAELRREIVRILLDISNPTTPALLPHFRELRRYYKKMGQPVQAQDAALSALRISEVTPITRGADLAMDLLDLGLILAAAGRWEHALGSFGRGVRVTRIVHGGDGPEMADAHLHWGDGCFLTGRHPGAREHYGKAMDILRAGPADSDAMAEGHARLGRLDAVEKRYKEAEQNFIRACEARAGAFGVDEPATAEDRLRLAAFQLARGRLAEAYAAMQRGMEIRQAHLEKSHPLIAEAACVWADIEAARNRPSDAESLYQSACLVFHDAYGPQSPDLGGALNNLSSLYHHHGHYEEAEKHLRRAQDIFSLAVGAGHPETAAVTDNLATLAAARLGHKRKRSR